MIGIMVGDIIQWTGDLFSGGSLQLHSVDNAPKVNAIGVPYDIEQLSMEQIQLKRTYPKYYAKIIKLAWKGADIAFEFLQEKIIGADRSDDGRVLKSTVNNDFTFSLIRWIAFRTIDFTASVIEDEPWKWGLSEVADAVGFVGKGVGLVYVNKNCGKDQQGSGGLAVASCGSSNFLPTLHDFTATVIDFGILIRKFVDSIESYIDANKTDWNALDYVAGIATTVAIGLDMILEPLNYISGFGDRFGGPKYQLFYIIVKGVTWIINLVSTIAEVT